MSVFDVFDLGKCTLHENGIEFHQQSDDTIYSRAIRHPTSQSIIKNQTLALRVKYQAVLRVKIVASMLEEPPSKNTLKILNPFASIEAA